MRDSRLPTRSSLLRLGSGAFLTLLALACTAPSIDERMLAPDAASSAKAPAGVSVSSTRPAYAGRDTTIDIRVFGSGFAAGAQATWRLHGVADPARVRTNSTTYVSSTELIANITISSDADLAFWDVAVAAGGKNGVGTEIFEVTTAEFLGTTDVVVAMNDASQIVGYDPDGIYIFDPSLAKTPVGLGKPWGIDPLGEELQDAGGNLR
jgi:hypothetical protein